MGSFSGLHHSETGETVINNDQAAVLNSLSEISKKLGEFKMPPINIDVAPSPAPDVTVTPHVETRLESPSVYNAVRVEFPRWAAYLIVANIILAGAVCILSLPILFSSISH